MSKDTNLEDLILGIKLMSLDVKNYMYLHCLQIWALVLYLFAVCARTVPKIHVWV